MGFDVNLNDDAPKTLTVERKLTGVNPGPDSALILTDASDTTPGGIMLPMSVQDQINTGTVVRIGAGGHDFAGHHIPPVASVGDRILFGHLTKCFKLDIDMGEGRKTYHLIDQDEILCVLEYDDSEGPIPALVDTGAGV